MKKSRAVGLLQLLVVASTPVIMAQQSARAGSADPIGLVCLSYNEGGSDCSFSSYAQCEATASGLGAECYGPPGDALTARAQLPGVSRNVEQTTIRGHRRHVRRRD
jgi:Protein of unknown function (DUF3551)